MKTKSELMKDFAEGKHGEATLEVIIDIRSAMIHILQQLRRLNGSEGDTNISYSSRVADVDIRES